MEKHEKPVYECPVCYEKLYSPIYQCYNGHLICNHCIDKVERCPVCRDRMPGRRIRNLEVEKITGKPTFACPNKTKGCLDVEEHSPQDCEFL
ncbi:unnamed protein product [Allacma fusca]|uniref:RING-type domain-containing protein n=1 Tax=Allacma fusca TaxID=39272 RepID=A0A8J2KSZ2_9HEXA|nr:unnamed protein product [Allacma fusca]